MICVYAMHEDVHQGSICVFIGRALEVLASTFTESHSFVVKVVQPISRVHSCVSESMFICINVYKYV